MLKPAALSALAAIMIAMASPALAQQTAQTGPLLTGQAAFTDWNQQAPGVRHKITVADLPAPAPDEAVNNGPQLVPKPKDAWPIAPRGFKVTLYAGGDFTPTAASSSINNQAPSVPVAPLASPSTLPPTRSGSTSATRTLSSASPTNPAIS